MARPHTRHTKMGRRIVAQFSSQAGIDRRVRGRVQWQCREVGSEGGRSEELARPEHQRSLDINSRLDVRTNTTKGAQAMLGTTIIPASGRGMPNHGLCRNPPFTLYAAGTSQWYHCPGQAIAPGSKNTNQVIRTMPAHPLLIRTLYMVARPNNTPTPAMSWLSARPLS